MEEQTATKFNATTIYISTAHRFVECQLPFGCRRCGMDNVRRHFSRMILTTTISKCFVRFVISMDFRSKLNLHFNVGPWIQSNAIVLNTNHIYWSFESFLAEFIRTFWIFHSIFRLFFSILTLRSMKKSPKKDSRLDLFELLHFFSRTVDSKILWNSTIEEKKNQKVKITLNACLWIYKKKLNKKFPRWWYSKGFQPPQFGHISIFNFQSTEIQTIKNGICHLMSDTPLFVTLHHYNFDSIFNDCHISIMNNALITRMEKWYNNSFLLLEEKTNNDYILCLSLPFEYWSFAITTSKH